MARHAMESGCGPGKARQCRRGAAPRGRERPDLSGQVQALPLSTPCMMHCTCGARQLRRRAAICVQVDAPADLPAVRARPCGLAADHRPQTW